MTIALAPALYIVATPIGNLGDLSARAKQVLAQVDLIAAEDTRHTQKLLTGLGIKTPIISCHEGNETARLKHLLGRLQQQDKVALVSDAGTPLISDPGYRLVRAVSEAGIVVCTVPGPSAVIAALSISGLPASRFIFEGFLPAKNRARQERLLQLAPEHRTLIFFEAPHRLSKALADISLIFGADREVVVARELSKLYETVYRGNAGALAEQAVTDIDMARGEIVVLVRGATEPSVTAAIDQNQLLNVLLQELGPAQASRIGNRLTGIAKADLYKKMLALKTPVD